MKEIENALTQRSKETFGDIFQEIATLEEVIKVQEIEFEVNPSGANRERLLEAQDR